MSEEKVQCPECWQNYGEVAELEDKLISARKRSAIFEGALALIALGAGRDHEEFAAARLGHPSTEELWKLAGAGRDAENTSAEEGA